MNSGPGAQSQKPEKEENVNFLVDNIYGQNAKSILDFNGSRRSIVVKSTLGDFWKNFGHWINSFFNRQFANSQNVSSISEKLAAQKIVHEIQLEHCIDKVQKFAKHVFGNIQLVSSCRKKIRLVSIFINFCPFFVSFLSMFYPFLILYCPFLALFFLPILAHSWKIGWKSLRGLEKWA